MVLEETLLFYDAEDAKIFLIFLKDHRCNARTTNKSSLLDESVIRGTIGNFLAMLEEKGFQDQRDRAGTELSDLPSLLSEAEDDEQVESRIRNIMFGNLKTGITRTRTSLQSLMDRYKPGDIIVLQDTKDELEKFPDPGGEESPEQDLETLVSKRFDHEISVQILVENGIAEDLQEGILMKGHVDPDDIVVERTIVLPDEKNNDLFRNHKIDLVRHLEYSTSVQLTIDPRIHFTCNPEEVEQVLEGLEVDVESAGQLINNLYGMNLLIHLVLEAITERQVVSLDDLTGLFGAFTPGPVENDEHMVIHTTEEFIRDLVDDLRKLRLIRGNNRAIRLV